MTQNTRTAPEDINPISLIQSNNEHLRASRGYLDRESWAQSKAKNLNLAAKQLSKSSISHQQNSNSIGNSNATNLDNAKEPSPIELSSATNKKHIDLDTMDWDKQSILETADKYPIPYEETINLQDPQGHRGQVNETENQMASMSLTGNHARLSGISRREQLAAYDSGALPSPQALRGNMENLNQNREVCFKHIKFGNCKGCHREHVDFPFHDHPCCKFFCLTECRNRRCTQQHHAQCLRESQDILASFDISVDDLFPKRNDRSRDRSYDASYSRSSINPGRAQRDSSQPPAYRASASQNFTYQARNVKDA